MRHAGREENVVTWARQPYLAIWERQQERPAHQDAQGGGRQARRHRWPDVARRMDAPLHLNRFRMAWASWRHDEVADEPSPSPPCAVGRRVSYEDVIVRLVVHVASGDVGPWRDRWLIEASSRSNHRTAPV